MDSPRVAIVREAYRLANSEDLSGLLTLLDDDVEFPDPIHGTIVRGKEEGAQLWHRVQAAEHVLMPGQVVEFGDAVIAVVHHQVYERDGGPLAGITEVHRFTFRDGRIARMDVTTLEELPEAVWERLG